MPEVGTFRDPGSNLVQQLAGRLPKPGTFRDLADFCMARKGRVFGVLDDTSIAQKSDLSGAS
jgi:hypothetical protein